MLLAPSSRPRGTVALQCWDMAGRFLSTLKESKAPSFLQNLRYVSTLKHEGITVTVTKEPKPKIHESVKSPSEIVFGSHFSDHMLLCHWSKDGGWEKPRIEPYRDIPMSLSMSVLHYATECFEGMKAYYGQDGKIRMFRPMENMMRLSRSAEASSLPEFNKEAFLECIKDLIRLDRDWVPRAENCSLYVRPTFIGTESTLGVKVSSTALLYCLTCPVGPYFATGTFNPVSLYADPMFIRAWPGGVGNSKMGGNYGPTIRVQKVAESKNCNQVLWLFGENHEVTEVGTMNFFVNWINENNEPEIATPPLSGTILPGVTRKSLLELGATWGTHKVVERCITMHDIIRSLKENRLREIFGAGTACVVCPVDRILYMEENLHIPTMDSGAEVAMRFYKELTDIQFGRTPHEWAVVVD